MRVWTWQYAETLFAKEERNEVIKLAYKILIGAITNQWEELICTSEHLVLRHQDRADKTFNLLYPYQRISFRDAFETILERDPIMRSYFQLEAQTDMRAVYRITQQSDVDFSSTRIPYE